MKKLFVTFCLLLIACPLFPVFFKHIGMKEGLSQLSVMSIYQDELGRMWFGTQEGLSMFNGNRTFSFKPAATDDPFNQLNSSYLGNSNFPIDGDKKGSLYIVSDGALLRYDFKEDKFYRLAEKGVRTVAYQDNKVWFSASDSLYIWRPETGKADFVLKLEGNYVQEIFVDSNKQLWLGTLKGLYLVGKNRQLKCVIPNEDIYEIFEDSKANLWIATRENGMYCRDKAGDIRKFMHEAHNPNSITSNHIRSFAEDNYGNLWIGTFTGLNKYNPRTKKMTVYTRDDLPGSLTHASVFATYKDVQGTLWIGTYYGGVHYFNPETDLFTYYSADASRNDCLSYQFVGHMVEDKDDNIWMCTEGGGLNFFDRKTKRFTYYKADEGENSIAHNNLKSICYSAGRNKLYIGTHTGGLSVYDITKRTFRNLNEVSAVFREKAGNVVNQVVLYNDSYLIMLTRKGILKMNLDTEELTSLFDSDVNYNGITFAIDGKDNIWIGQSAGIQRINLKNEQDQTIYRNNEKGLGRFGITKVFVDRNGRMFFGTHGGGVFSLDSETDTFTRYATDNDLLQSNYCYDIVQSNQGYLIISGDKGLSFLYPERKTLRAAELGTALPISAINDGCGMLVCRNGEVFVGGTDGATSFYEEALFAASKDYRLYFSELYVNNELIHPLGKIKSIHESFPYLKKIVLKHNQNNVTITFASNNYISTLNRATYEYRLEGNSDQWIVNTNREITYTNLAPGRYVLHVREKEYDPSVLPKSIEMEIIVKSPFYATPLAYTLYLLLIAAVLIVFYRFKHAQLVLRTSLDYERKEKDRIEELNQAKLQFFSNISHEFRTPLTLIIAQIELLLQGGSLAPTVYGKLLKIYKNASQMLSLISELLDFRKLELGHITLKVSEQNLVGFVKDIYLSFNEYAVKKNIDYRFQSPADSILCWYDANQLQKVFYNLLNNAFKFTKQNGTIEVVMEETDGEIVVKVIDSGVGINKEELSRIFDRFYQSESGRYEAKTSPGTGIGLSLAKSIIELHHGQVTAESRPGYGSIFIVRLPKGADHFTDNEISTDARDQVTQPAPVVWDREALADDLTAAGQSDEADGELRTMLIVEDNDELLQILTSLFTGLYRVVVARNGKEGLQMAMDEKPDIVLSDIMMPEMTGTEMCVRIKNNFDLCHIPVVLLTALTTSDQSIEGLQRGADDYIGKPFNAKVLVARCNNLVRNRIILQKKFTRQQNFETMELANNPIDQRFLDTVSQIISDNIDNMEFDMNLLAKELGLSRSSLFAKFKALTGMTPNDFVLNYKLKRAAQMLKSNPDMQIAEISDQLGFGSPRYFSRCFKAQFNITPADYRKKEDKQS